MNQRFVFRYWWAVVLITVIIISGCALPGPKVAETSALRPKPAVLDSGWWYARFRIDWPENTEPSWHIDIMLADKVISPVLNQYRDTIALWRFHRRAARDTIGHQFSFIFYTSADTAQSVYDSIRSDPLVKQLKQAGLIIQCVFDDTVKINRPAIEDTSDKSWSAPVQKTWPHYIMGVSQMWLHLISEIVAEEADRKEFASLKEIQEFYRQVNESVNASWQEEGRHAYLHHLNAIFGYEPIIIYEERLMKF